MASSPVSETDVSPVTPSLLLGGVPRALGGALGGGPKAVKTEGVHDDELSASFKMEMEENGGAGDRCYSSLMTLVNLLDAEVLLQAAGNKIFERFSIWDLMVEKVRNWTGDSDLGTLPLLIADFERVLLELKQLVELSMDFIYEKPIHRKTSLDPGEYYMGDFTATALCVEGGIWRRKTEDLDLDYEFPVDLETLLPKNPVLPPNVMLSFMKPKKRKRKLAVMVKEELELSDGGTVTVEADVDAIAESDMDEGGGYGVKQQSKRGRKRGPRGKYKARRARGSDDEDVKVKIEGEDEDAKTRKTKMKFTREKNRYFCQTPGCPDSDTLRVFPNRTEFEAHWLTQHMTPEDRVIQCSVEGCEIMFSLTSERNKHMESAHERETPCTHCDKKFYSHQEVVSHGKRWHTEDGQTRERPTQDDLDPNCVCAKCGKKFTNQKAVDKHEVGCDGIFVRQPCFYKAKVGNNWVCQQKDCANKTQFESEYSFRNHFYDAHLTEAEKLFVCKYCQQRFAFRTMLNKHISASHEKKHVCDFCGRKFGAKNKLAQHVYTHTGEKPFLCDRCDFRTASKYNLDQHKQSKHQDFAPREHYCELCGKGFVSQGRVRQHKKVIHRDGRDQEAPIKRKSNPAKKAVAQANAASAAAVQAAQVVRQQQQQQLAQAQAMAQAEEQVHHIQPQPAHLEYIPNDLHHQFASGQLASRWNHLFRK